MHNYHNFSTNNCGFGWGHIVPVDYGSIPNEKYRAIIVSNTDDTDMAEI